ncbi:unnamed protein product [Rhodiola kirilowii]
MFSTALTENVGVEGAYLFVQNSIGSKTSPIGAAE